MGRSQWQDLKVCYERTSTPRLMLCLPKPTQRFPGGQPCFHAVYSAAAPPLQAPYCRNRAGAPRGPRSCPAPGAFAMGYSSTLHSNVLMAMLNFQDRELRSAFDKFSKISQLRSRPVQINNKLLLYAIYAVECGLKYLLLRKYRKTRTRNLPEDCELNHDLNSLLKTVEIGRRNFRIGPYKRKLEKNESISSERLHELYRYGGQLDNDSEEKLLRDLSEIFEQINHRMSS